MANHETITRLVETIKETRGLNSMQAHAYACGMLGCDVPEESVLNMIESLTRKAN